MITNDIIKDFKDYGLNLTPVIKSSDPNKDKKPESKNGKWFYDWSESDLLSAQRIGAFHKQSRIYDIDFDDKSFVAHKFMSLLPETLTIGKLVNGREVATHKIYALPEGVETKKYSYPNNPKSKGGKIIELLPSTQTIVAGDDRVVINNVKPLILEPSRMQLYCRLIAAFTELYKHWPAKGEGQRDEAHLRLAGALTRETDIDLDLKKEFVKKLCELTNDDEVKNRVSKLDYQLEQYQENPDQVCGVKSLSDFLKVNLPAFDEIKKSQKEDDVETDLTPIEFSDHEEFLGTYYSPPEYILEPLIGDKQIIQIVGESGVGKTMYGLTIAGSIAAGSPLLDFVFVGKPRPILYIEGELPGSDIQTRIRGMKEKLKNKISKNYFNVATLQQQLEKSDSGFEPIQTEKGLKKIELALYEIKRRTGVMPVVFIDNISCLAPGLEENAAEAWSPIINRFVRWKNLGATVIYFHHLNKSKTSSGSTMQDRTIDMVLRMKKPNSNQKLKTFEKQGVQAIVDFGKWRLHDNSVHAKEHMLICEDWVWQKLPILKEDEYEVKQLWDEGVRDPKVLAEELGIGVSTIYRKLEKLKSEGVIEDEVSRKTANSDAKDIC